MNLTSKITSVASNPAMLSTYIKWVGSRILAGKQPRISLGKHGGASLGEWLSFSEYWCFQDIVPDRERLFVERCMAGCANQKSVAIDVGANIGAFTLLIADMGCTVHAFEPIPETFCRLKKNLKFNDKLVHAHLNCLAVGEEQGLVRFTIQENSPATNRMASPGELSSGNHTYTQVVAAVSLDHYCAENGIENIAFLKIDVEGMEPYVLKGARNLLLARKVASVLIEICPKNLRSVGLTCADLYREFELVRYTPYLLSDDGTPGAKLTLADIEAMRLANVVLLPDA
jgi:FkbM family methyltransferase